MEYLRAILREISDTYTSCISSHPNKAMLNLQKAREQHAAYRKTLEELGIEIILLEKENEFPDACFVEDNAIIHRNKAFISTMGVEGRRGEEVSIAEILKDYKKIQRATGDAIIEGGDVIHLDSHLISGNTQRTNQEGINQASDFLNIDITTIKDNSIMHLKSYVTYLADNVIVTTAKYANHPEIEKFEKIIVPPDESYAANTLMVNDYVIIPSNYPKTKSLIEDARFNVITLDTSEIEKCEGALTCMSLLF